MVKEFIPLAIRKSLGARWDDWRQRRTKAHLLRSLQGSGTICNLCAWEGARFTDDCWHRGTICPNCGSQVRHRMLAAAFDGQSHLQGISEAELLHGKCVLHFAPERQLRERIQAAASRFVTADFVRGDCDLRLDISKMPEVPTASFDALIVCDVLEHVPDDHAALLEIHRTLKPGGIAILSVPQTDSPASTVEDPSVSSESEREKRFGQKDHVRMYGDDFLIRLEAAGFAVQILTRHSLPDSIVARHVLHPPVLNPNPLATNHRRIYFARTPLKPPSP